MSFQEEQAALRRRSAEIDQQLARLKEKRDFHASMASNLTHLGCMVFLLPFVFFIGLLLIGGCLSMLGAGR